MKRRNRNLLDFFPQMGDIKELIAFLPEYLDSFAQWLYYGFFRLAFLTGSLWKDYLLLKI